MYSVQFLEAKSWGTLVEQLWKGNGVFFLPFCMSLETFELVLKAKLISDKIW